MKTNKLSFPHPVLGVNDDVSGEYKIKSSPMIFDENEIKIEINHILSNSTLENLIKEGGASFCVELNCPQTFYRHAFLSSDNKQLITLKSKDLRSKVFVSFFIVAQKDINDYQVKGSNSDYSDFKFEVRKSDVLAYGGDTFFIAGKRWESLKMVDNFMEVEKYDKKNGPAKFVLSPEKIIIQLPENDFQKYNNVYRAQNFSSYFLSSIAFPALLYAVSEMIHNTEANEESMWYQIIDARKQQEKNLQNISWDSENIPEIVQELLNNPIEKTLGCIEKTISQEDTE